MPTTISLKSHSKQRKFILSSFIVLISFGCSSQSDKNEAEKPREKAIDNIPHVEESIHLEIDSLPRLSSFSGEKKLVNIGDVDLYVEVEGKGLPMILLHGGPGGTQHYFHPWFSKAAKFSKVVYYDQRGCGQSGYVKGENGYSFEQAVNDLEELRKSLGIEKIILVGYSYGGALAQYYSSKFKENVLGMVLINASPMFENDLLWPTRQYDYISSEESEKIREIYHLYRSGEISQFQFMYNKGINGDWKRQNYLKPTEEEFIRSSLYEWIHDEGFNQVMSRSYQQYDLSGKFDDFEVPTLICEGLWDLTWSERKKDLISENHPNAQFMLFENSGHNIFSDEAELFFEKLESFVGGLNER